MQSPGMEWTCASAIFFRNPLKLEIQGLPAAWQFKQPVTSCQTILCFNYSIIYPHSVNILDSPLEFEQTLCMIIRVHHYNGSMGKELKNIISNASLHFACGRFYRGSRHFEIKASWSRTEIEEKLTSPNCPSEAPLERAATKPI